LPKKPLITIVDDDTSLRKALKSLMASLGFAVQDFPSAPDFLASPDFAGTSCLIADINMPRMTGVELHRQLLGTGHDIPTILITAYPDERIRAEALNRGVIGYLTKPFDENALLECINSALARPGPEGQDSVSRRTDRRRPRRRE
jgi:FixJ family two-component response regulator